MALPFGPRVPVAAELKVVAMRAGEVVVKLEAITVEMVEAEETPAAAATAVAGMVVVEATAAEDGTAVDMAAVDTATTVAMTTRVVVMVMVTGEAVGTIDRDFPVTYLISGIENLL